jgi:hypothetical protein
MGEQRDLRRRRTCLQTSLYFYKILPLTTAVDPAEHLKTECSFADSLVEHGMPVEHHVDINRLVESDVGDSASLSCAQTVSCRYVDFER